MTYNVIDTRTFYTGEHCVMIVATAGHDNDWAAYIGGFLITMKVEEAEQMVAAHGTKLSEEQALAFFPAGFVTKDVRDPVTEVLLYYRR